MVGRERELADVNAALDAHRLVTITGLGGVGKTRLAREVASQLARLGRSSWFVDLAPVTTLAGVVDTIATRIGVGETADRDLEGAVIERLHDGPNVLVLDNLEHLSDERPFFARLLADVPSLTILATSRVALVLAGEHELRLDSLAGAVDDADIEAAPATRLFLMRARDRGHLRTVDARDAPAVAMVCRRLDGLPLAIELAAAWTGVLSPRAIARRIDDATLPLADESRPRHVSLEQVVSATLNLTSDGDRQVFDRLGVFVGPFDDAAVAAVCDADAGVLAALRNLEAASLVRVAPDENGEPEFTLLETVRAIARRRLEDAGSPADAEARHGAWYAQQATTAADDLRSKTFNNAQASARLADPNVRVAFERAVVRGDAEIAGRLAAAFASYGVQAGVLRESANRLRTALAMDGASPGTRADLLTALLNVRGMLGEHGDQAPLGRQAVALARESGSERTLVRAMIALASWALVDPIELLIEAGDFAERIGYAWGAAAAWNNLGSALGDRDRHEEAVDVYGKAVLLFAARGDAAGEAMALMSRAGVELQLARTADALVDVREAERKLPADGGGSVAFRLWTHTTRAIAEASAGLHAEAAGSLAGTVDTVVSLDSAAEYDGWFEAAAAVLAVPHPVLAARCLGGLDAVTQLNGSPASNTRLNRRITAGLERSIGRHRLEVARASGRTRDRRALFDELAAAARADAARTAGPYGDLTPRERRVLELLARGRTDPEIGVELGIAPKTASVHVANLKAKLGVDTRVEAVLFARDNLRPDA